MNSGEDIGVWLAVFQSGNMSVGCGFHLMKAHLAKPSLSTQTELRTEMTIDF